MTQENKDLLLKDLSTRLSYGVKCKVSYNSGVINDADATLYGVDKDGFLMFDEIDGYHREFLCKPYLFPLSSMTEEQERNLNLYLRFDKEPIMRSVKEIDWFNKHHFDYRNSIERNLAIDCTNLNIY